MKKISTKIFIPILLIFLISNIVIAETLTVVAKSGLSLREKPNQNSKRLDVAKFGELVNCNSCSIPSNPCCPSKKIITIDGKAGYWIKVEFNNKWGYMFSGYLVLGDIFPKSRTESIDNVFIDRIFVRDDYIEGIKTLDSFNFMDYVPDLNWYGMKINENSFTVTQTKITPIYNNNRWEKGYSNIYDVYLDVENGHNYDFLFGTKKRLIEGSLLSNYHRKCGTEIGVFLYPEEQYPINYNDDYYLLKAIEEFYVDKRFNRNYVVNLMISKDTIRISELDNLFTDGVGHASLHAMYQTPKLFWSGDINGDNFLDFIFEARPMSDKCGPIPHLKLVYSVINNKEVEYRVNKEVIGYKTFIKNPALNNR